MQVDDGRLDKVIELGEVFFDACVIFHSIFLLGLHKVIILVSI